jgi:branched-chain amino acid transport system substrate-binding protein
MYFDAVAKYGDPKLEAASAATISFRNVMIIWMLLTEIEGPITKASLLERVRAARDHPSFAGHPFTCDGQQIPDLPALCSPQEVLVENRGDELVPITGWIDVPALVKAPGST